MPNLSWLGKDKVVTYHQKVPFHFLDKKFSVGNSDNAIIHGDNLIALKSLLPRYENKVKCIYIDPPYNTGNENWIYNDNVSDSRLQKWIGEVVGKEGEDLTRHDKWLCMMYPRLRLLQKLLSDDGAIFISIDDNELFSLKFICDEIFGANNFFAMLTRRSMHTVRNSSKDFNKNSDFVLVYGKNKAQLTSDKNARIREKVDKAAAYKLNDNDGRGFYKLDPIYARNYAKPYTFKFQNGIVWTAPEGSYPRYSIETLQQMELNNQLDFNGKFPRAKRYLNEVQEGQPPDTFLKEEKVGFNSDGTKILAQILGIDKAFNQPKPVQFIEYLIGILPNNEDSIILDAFAGSGTTAHAVINLNKQDGGNRKFILIELNDYAENITAERVKRVGGEFDFYEIGESLFDEDGFINSAVPREKLFEYIYYSETRKNYVPTAEENLMGVDDDTAYYYFGGENLSWTTLAKIKTRAKNYVIYAEACNLSENELMKYQIHFRKIPNEIRRF